jgi:hypothetical protein
MRSSARNSSRIERGYGGGCEVFPSGGLKLRLKDEHVWVFNRELHAMTTSLPFPLEGGCDCRHIRYRMDTPPLFVHCCHCRWCQRETGASFALNAMIEADRVSVLGAEPELIDTPSESGKGQKIARCPKCRIAVWSNYAGAGPLLKFVRVGTLDNPDCLPPDIHIFTASRQPWVILPAATPAVSEYYDREQYWPAESLARWQALLPGIRAYRASLQDERS